MRVICLWCAVLLVICAGPVFAGPPVQFRVSPSNPLPCSPVSVSAHVDFPDACYELVSFTHTWTSANRLSISVTVRDTNPPGTYCALMIQTLGGQAHLGSLAAGRYYVDARFYVLPYSGSFPSLYTSGSITFDVTSPSTPGAKLLADGQSVCLSGKAVTYAAPGFFYVEEDSRASGIRVEKTGHGLTVGIRADIGGTVQTNTHGERFIAATSASASGTGSIAPIFVTNSALGGADWRYKQSTGEGQIGISGARGLCNIGLLVRLQGKVTGIESGAIHIDDGSGHLVRAALPSGMLPPASGTQVVVTGVVSCLRETVAGQTYQRRTVLAREVAALQR